MTSEKLWRAINSQYEIFATLINVLLVLLAIWLHAALLNVPLLTVIVILLCGLLIFDYRLRKTHEWLRWNDETDRFMAKLLKTAATSMMRASQPPISHIRASLMFPDKEQNLVIRYAYGFDSHDADRKIQIPIGTGPAGVAWLQGRSLVADLDAIRTDNHAPRMWGIPEEEARKIRPSLRSVLSIPVRAGSHYDIVAVLNFDTDNSITDTGFLDDSIQRIGYSFASAFSELLDRSRD